MTAQVEIVRLAFGGDGVAYLDDGRVVFVRGGLPGDTVEIEITKHKKRFAKAVATRVIAPGLGRRPPTCAYVDALRRGCGGCDFQAAHYVQEWTWKSEAALEAFCRNARIDQNGVDVQRFSSGQPVGYRRRLRVHLDGDGRVGFYGHGSHEIVGLGAECEVLHPVLRHAASVLGLRGPGTALMELDGDGDGVVVRAEVPPQPLPAPTPPIVGLEIVTRQGSTAWGDTDFNLDVRSLRRHLPLGVFTQANARMNEVLIVRALTALDLQHGERVLELYCGAGNFSLDIARQGGHVVGFDVGADAVAAGNAAAAQHGLAGRVSLHHADLRKGVPPLDRPVDAVLLDPPRSGAKDVIPDLAQLSVPKIVYVSCDPATAGRDAAHLVESGYSCEHVSLVDMFPRTSHVELVALLRR